MCYFGKACITRILGRYYNVSEMNYHTTNGNGFADRRWWFVIVLCLAFSFLFAIQLAGLICVPIHTPTASLCTNSHSYGVFGSFEGLESADSPLGVSGPTNSKFSTRLSICREKCSTLKHWREIKNTKFFFYCYKFYSLKYININYTQK